MAGTETRKHYLMLDGLRGIAALVIVLSHLGEALAINGCIAHAHLAVEYFLLLSGFVLAYAYDGRWTDGMTVRGFFLRRLKRLHPLVPVAVLLGLVPALLTEGDVLGPWWQVALAAVGCSLMIPAFPTGLLNPFNGPVWTLFYEYFANVVYALFLRRLGKRTLLALMAVAAAATTAVALRIDLFGLLLHYGYTFKAGWGARADHLYVALTRLAFPLLTGLFICRAGLKIRLRHAFWPCAVVFVVLMMVPVFPGENPWRGSLLNGVYELAVVLAAWPLLLLIGAGDEMDGKSRTARFARFVGGISFPLYMTHYPLRMLLGWFLKGQVQTLSTAACVFIILGFYAVALPLAWAVRRFYADPVGRWLR